MPITEASEAIYPILRPLSPTMKSIWAILLLIAVFARGAAVNDPFLSRTAISNEEANVVVYGSFDDATKEPGEPAHGSTSASESIWWTWTAPENGVLTLLGGGKSEPHVLAAYTGTKLSALVAVAHATNLADAGTQVRFNVKAGAAYQIVAARFPGHPPPSGADKRFMLSVQFTPASSSSNDAYAKRIELAGDFTTGLGVNTAASKESGEPVHAGNEGGRSLWWTWTARKGRGLVTLSTQGSHARDSSTGTNRPVNTLLAVYTGQDGPLGALPSLSLLKALAANDDADGESVHSEVKFHAAALGNYAFAVDGVRDLSDQIDAGNLILTLRVERSNDDFADRAVISKPSALVTGTNAGATNGNDGPATAHNTVWWTWRAPADGTVTLSTAGSTFDTRLDVFTGATLSGLVPVASSDDVDPSASPPVLTSAVEFTVASGTNYQIAVGGKDTATGAIKLDLNFVADFPAIVTQPVSRSITVGSSASFSVVATGKPSPALLWQRRLAGTKTWLPMEGETAATLTLDEVPQSAHGDSFRCEVSNPLGKVVSAIATLGVTPPPPAITLPDTLRIRGAVDIPSAPDDAPAELRYYARSLPPGLAMDPLTGRITGTITKAGAFTVAYWSQAGKVKSALQKITFVVLPIPQTMAGSFEGLLVSGPDDAGQPVGKLSVKVSDAGAFSGTLVTTDQKPFPLRGVLALSDDFSAASARLLVKRNATASYELDLRLSSDSALSAELREGEILKAAAHAGVKLPAYTTKNPSPGVGAYTATLRGAPLDAEDTRIHPLGTGYATASIARDGKLKLAGKLSDGVRFTASLPRGADAAYRLYLKPYKTAGNSLAGALPFVSRADEPSLQHAATGDVYWLKPANAKDAAFPAGFGPIEVAVSVEPWLKIANLGAYLDLPFVGSNHEFSILLDEAGISNLPPNPRELPVRLLVTPKGAVLAPVPNPSAWSTRINLATGAFTGGFRVQDPHPLTDKPVKRTVKIEGVLQQLPADAASSVFGRGFFLAKPVVKGGPTLSGKVELAPPPPGATAQ